jgi:DNA-binding transcriptional ArsR family regulator
MTNQAIRPLTDRFKALSHPMRLRMLALLKDGESCVCQMMEVFDPDASTTSEHLSELRRTGLLRERRWLRPGERWRGRRRISRIFNTENLRFGPDRSAGTR